MEFQTNRAVLGVEAPPIAEALTWVREGDRNRPLIDLCQALPKYPPAPQVAREIGRLALEEPTNLYTDIFGLDGLRQALALHMTEDYGGRIEAENVAITPGCNQAFAAAAMALAGPGDNVILPVPFYFNHDMWLRMLGVEPRYVQAITKGSAVPRPEMVVPLIDGNTRAIALCSPNNPTGAIYPADVLRAFYDIAQAHGIALLLDETYKDFRADPSPAHAL